MKSGKGSEFGFFFIMLAGIFWGTCGTAQSMAPAGANPLILGDLRMLLGGAFLFLILSLKGSTLLTGSWPLLNTLGAAVCMAGMQLFFFSAMMKTGVAIGTMVAVGTLPVIQGLAGRLFFHEKLDIWWMIAAILAISGCILLCYRGNETYQLDPFGIFLAVCASSCGTLSNVFIKRVRDFRRPVETMAVVLFTGGLVASPLLLSLKMEWIMDPRSILVAIHLGLVTAALGYSFFAFGIKTTPLSKAGILTLTEPLTAFLLGVLLLKEQMSPLMIIGSVLLSVGFIVLSVSPGKN
ncbi:MAG: EamA family transporter [Synergistales bacterium]|nr:EamA family transporter [Synergistales bacterium]